MVTYETGPLAKRNEINMTYTPGTVFDEINAEEPGSIQSTNFANGITEHTSQLWIIYVTWWSVSEIDND